MNRHPVVMVLIVLALMTALVACSPPPRTPVASTEAHPTLTSPAVVESLQTPEAISGAEKSTETPPCDLAPVVAPTPPAEFPGYAELDPATGLHVTGRAQTIDLESYVLEVTGKVDEPLELSYDDLRCMPKIEVQCLLICPGFFEDEAAWAGVSLRRVLEMAGVQENASGINLISVDGYSTPVSLRAARAEHALLAYEWEGEPLPILHGFPVRAVFPELEGNRWVKWLVEIEVY